jgi:Family of unknown function (DUF6328)
LQLWEASAARQNFGSMELSKKVKLALDETRMLILGAQILLGFQFRGAFSDGYDQLPTEVRYLNGLALGLMVLVVGLLIAPGPYHRIVEGGADTSHFHAVVTVIADLALAPFALALGLDLFIAAGRIFGETGGAAAAITAAALAIAFWYGYPRVRKRLTGEWERAMTSDQTAERSTTPLHAKIEQMLTEARVVLPGAQALFGFQLAIVLTQSFDQLPSASRITHAASLFLVALAVVLLMAPAAYHRIVYAGEESQGMYRVGSALVMAATVPLAIGLAGDVYVVFTKIAASPTAGVVAGGFALALLIGLWHAYPLVAASMRSHTAR